MAGVVGCGRQQEIGELGKDWETSEREWQSPFLSHAQTVNVGYYTINDLLWTIHRTLNPLSIGCMQGCRAFSQVKYGRPNVS